MGETSPFIKHTFDSASDVSIALAGLPSEISKASELAASAVAELTSAALAGDKAAAGVANEKLGQTLGALNDLTADHAKALAFVPGAPEAKVK